MKNRILVAAAFSALTLLGVAAPAMAGDNHSYSYQSDRGRNGPPALRVEIQPSFRSGYIWIPGFWDLRASRYFWVPGNYVRERRGYNYHHHSWRNDNGRWVAERGRWQFNGRDYRHNNRNDSGHRSNKHRDSDGDGVPNRYDSQPNNPYRR